MYAFLFAIYLFFSLNNIHLNLPVVLENSLIFKIPNNQG